MSITPPAGFFARLRARLLGSQLRANIASGLGSNVLSAIVAVAAYPIYLHYLGYEKYGLWLVLSTVVAMAQLGNFGISPALLKLVAEDFALGDIDGVYRYISTALLGLIAIGLLCFGGVVLFRDPIVGLFALQGANRALVSSMVPYVALLSVYVLVIDALNCTLAGLGRYDLVSYTQITGQATTFLVSLLFLHLGFGVWGLFFGSAANLVFLNLVSFHLIRRITGSAVPLRVRWDRERFRRILHFGSWVFGGNVINMMLTPLNRLFVARYVGVAAVPAYDIAYLGAMKIRAFLESGFRALTPEFSSLRVSSAALVHERLAATDRKGSKVVLYGGTALYCGVFVIAGWALHLWLGSRFSPQLPGAFRILLVGTYASLWSVQPYYTLLGFGRSRQILYVQMITAFLNIAYVYGQPWLFHQPISLTTILVATSLGMVGAAVYLRWEASRLRTDIANSTEPVPA